VIKSITGIMFYVHESAQFLNLSFPR